MTNFETAICTGLNLHEQRDVDFLDNVLSRAERVVVLFDGANRSRSSHLHPFTPLERMEMLWSLYPEETHSGRLTSHGLDIEPYNRQKQIEASRLALSRLEIDWQNGNLTAFIPTDERKNRIKRLLTGFKTVEIEMPANNDAPSIFDPRYSVPESLRGIVSKWKTSNEFFRLADEAKFCAGYREQWSGSPYPPTFNAADAIIECEERILFIVRGRPPFKGLYALPGGMIEQDEPLFNTALREAAEEVGLTNEALEPHFVWSWTFDDPTRDPRGRFISKTHLFRIPGPPPDVVAGDDAAQALWMSLSDLHPSMLAFDHWNVICKMLDISWSPEDGYRMYCPGPDPAAG